MFFVFQRQILSNKLDFMLSTVYKVVSSPNAEKTTKKKKERKTIYLFFLSCCLLAFFRIQ